MNFVIRNIAISVAVALIFGGCAKQELLKKDQSSLQATNALPAKTNTPKPGTQPIKSDAIVQEPLTSSQSPQAGTSETSLQASLNKIYFDFDSSALVPAARNTLTGNAQTIKGKAGIHVTIEGHTDERGSDEYNLALGEKRALAARNYLITLGIPAASLSTISYGKEKPDDPGHNESAWGKNRRDEFVVGAH